ncbi:MAG: hypothetical protein K2K76_05450 [Muribaculaceae bacterium]|nr:hypothetical protein [Muribaculaceae bacterium]
MSIINGLLRALGFGGGNEDDEELDLTTEVAALPESVESQGQSSQGGDTETAVENASAEADVSPSAESSGILQSDRRQGADSNVNTKAIFDGVVEVLNSNLPPYLRQCLDSEEQCKFIYEHLDESLRGFIAGVAKAEAEKANRRWASEKKRLFKQVNDAAEQIAHATERASKAEEKALSADRQKRAMTQRTADLERRVARLQAEIEQYDLEKNSLLNKLRVAEVQGGHSVVAADTHVANPETAANGQLAKDLEAAKAEIETLRAKLEEANRSLEVVSEIQRQMQSIEEMKKRKNARIKELKAENTQLRTALEAMKSAANADVAQPEPAQEDLEPVTEAENAAQESSDSKGEVIDMTQEPAQAYEPDATGVSAVIADDMDMIAAISESDAMTGMGEPAVMAKKKRKPRARKPKLVAIDQSISESEWLLSSSPMPQDTSMSGFGYQEPPRRNTPPDNPAQMSLW